MSGKVSRKRKKEYYIKCAKASKSHHLTLEPGSAGFLISCNNREREAVREAYNLLNQYADKIYGPEQTAGEDSDGDLGDDVAAALSKEIDSLKQQSRPSVRRFQQVRSGAKNVIFIKTQIEDPVLLVHTVFEQAYESQTSVCRYIMRLLPVSGTVKIHEADDIKPLAIKTLKEHFQVPQSPSYCIMFKARNNSKIKKEEIYKIIGSIIEDMNPASRVDFSSPDIVIDIDVICSICCMGVVKDFHKFRRYNLQEVVSAKSNNAGKENTTDTGSKKDGSVSTVVDQVDDDVTPDAEGSVKKELEGKATVNEGSVKEEVTQETTDLQTETQEKSNGSDPANVDV